MSLQVYIDGEEVEMDPKDLPGFTYSISDPLEPGSIKGTRSTTWKVPATNKAKAMLGSAVMSERPGLEPKELVLSNYGNVFLKNKIRPIEWERDEIRAVVVGNNASWLPELRSMRVNDMDLGATGLITASLIQASWFDEDLMHIFPIIDYGYDFSSSTGMGIDAVRPGIRCHRVISKAFNDLGYSVKVEGPLKKAWKKFIIPATESPVLASDYLAGESMTISTVGTVTSSNIVTPWNELDPFPPPVSIPLPPPPRNAVDPGQNLTLGVLYTTPFLMDLRIRLRIAIKPLYNLPGAGAEHQIYAFRFDNGDVLTPPTTVVMLDQQGYFFDLVVSELGIAAGTAVGVAISSHDRAPNYEVSFCEVTYEVLRVPYQENVSVDLAKSAPRLTVYDILKGISLIKGIAIDTNDALKQVTISYLDDKYKSTDQGVSMVGREDHTDAPIKQMELRPSRVLFLYQEDEEDGPLTTLSEECGERGFGGVIHEVPGGVLDDKVITMPFAATRMKMYPGNMFLPAIRLEQSGSNPAYKWKPRILIHDGVSRGEWTLQGAAQQVYPNCYFVSPLSKEHGLSFSPESSYGDTGPGTFSQRWGKFFRRFDRSYSLEIDLLLYDDEVAAMDMGVPVEVSDGHSAGWYYFTKIDRKRFGSDEYTRCELIQV